MTVHFYLSFNYNFWVLSLSNLRQIFYVLGLGFSDLEKKIMQKILQNQKKSHAKNFTKSKKKACYNEFYETVGEYRR